MNLFQKGQNQLAQANLIAVGEGDGGAGGEFLPVDNLTRRRADTGRPLYGFVFLQGPAHTGRFGDIERIAISYQKIVASIQKLVFQDFQNYMERTCQI